MAASMFKKWWVLLIQGILLLILGFYIFKNPVEVLAGISLWAGILILITGIAGIFGWIFAGKGERDAGTLIWSLLSVIFGLFILMNLLAAMMAVTIVFGIWVLMIGFTLISHGWILKNEKAAGWFIFIVGILGVIAGLMMILDVGTGAEGVAVVLGLQIILSGIAMILLSFVKKSLAGHIKDKIDSHKR